MQRIIFSFFFGIIFPTVCFLSIGTATDFMPRSVLTVLHINGESAPGILLSPFSIPIYLGILMNQTAFLPEFCKTAWFRISLIVLFDWTLYGMLFYIIWGKIKFRKNGNLVSEKPPDPPIFG